MELIGRLVQDLGVSEDQAAGGAGLLLSMARDKLSSGEFARISEYVPGVEGMLSAAPGEGGGGDLLGAVGGLVSSFGGGAANLGALTSLAGGFGKLGLDAGMVAKFVPILLDFVRERGGDDVAGLLGRVLSGD